MAAITGSIEISRPPDEVFRYCADPARQKEWQDSVQEVAVETDGPPAVGTRVRETRLVTGGPRTFQWEITVYEPPQRWSFRGIDGPVRPFGTMTLSPLDAGARTRAAFEIDFEGHGLGHLFKILARRGAPKQVESDLQNLKRELEGGRAAPSPTPG